MYEYWKYRANLAKLNRQKNDLRTNLVSQIHKARKEGKLTEEIQSLEHQLYFEDRMIDEEIAILTTDYLLGKAKRHFVPIPSRDKNGIWEKCKTISNRYVLTNRGISQLRSSLRKNRKEQIEIIIMILAALTGIIGAVTGLVAVILR